ncbi:MAG: Hsp20/alpha crystallin family protein [Alloprevotella sp.]|nr:Hsp20/alpha crystallin family protein [Alloprevotella sp.]
MLPTKRYNQNWIPSIFDDFFDYDWMKRTNATAPAINVAETEKAYEVEVAAPGMSKENFHIHIDEDNNLVISMERKGETSNEQKERRYLRREFNYTKFQQALILPDDVDRKEISAKVENGVLLVELPKQTPEQKQQLMQHIEVK